MVACIAFCLTLNCKIYFVRQFVKICLTSLSYASIVRQLTLLLDLAYDTFGIKIKADKTILNHFKNIDKSLKFSMMIYINQIYTLFFLTDF